MTSEPLTTNTAPRPAAFHTSRLLAQLKAASTAMYRLPPEERPGDVLHCGLLLTQVDGHLLGALHRAGALINKALTWKPKAPTSAPRLIVTFSPSAHWQVCESLSGRKPNRPGVWAQMQDISRHPVGIDDGSEETP